MQTKIRTCSPNKQYQHPYSPDDTYRDLTVNKNYRYCFSQICLSDFSKHYHILIRVIFKEKTYQD